MEPGKILVDGSPEVFAFGLCDADLAALVIDDVIHSFAASRSREPRFDTNGEVRDRHGHSPQHGGDELAPRGLVCETGVSERAEIDIDFLHDLRNAGTDGVIDRTRVCAFKML